MIRVTSAWVACSVQDLGRFGQRFEGHCGSGAMDALSLRLANRCAGAPENAAAVEIGPGPFAFVVEEPVTVVMGGAPRVGVPMWEPIRLKTGDSVEITAPTQGVWSYLAIQGGFDVPIIRGSRSFSVREGIGGWLQGGDALSPVREGALNSSSPEPVVAPAMIGPVRIFGDLPGNWKAGAVRDRMGYHIEGDVIPKGRADEWSEPVLPGFIQMPPLESGGRSNPIVLMPEASTVGGFTVLAVVHSEDLRLIAQSSPGQPIDFVKTEI